MKRFILIFLALFALYAQADTVTRMKLLGAEGVTGANLTTGQILTTDQINALQFGANGFVRVQNLLTGKVYTVTSRDAFLELLEALSTTTFSLASSADQKTRPDFEPTNGVKPATEDEEEEDDDNNQQQTEEENNNVQRVSNVLGITPTTTTTTTTTTQTTTPQQPATTISDRRLKEGIKKIGVSPSGIPIYQFRYKADVGISGLHTGVMAQDLLSLKPNAVVRLANGFLGVDYSKLDVVPSVSN